MRSLVSILAVSTVLVAFSPVAEASHGECELLDTYLNGDWTMGVLSCYGGRGTYVEYSAELADGSSWMSGRAGQMHSYRLDRMDAPTDVCLSVTYFRGGHAYPVFVAEETPFGAYTLCGAIPPNTPPTAEAGADLHALPSRDITITASYVDPDAGDSHTATIAWGDGTIEHVSAADGIIAATHDYGGRGEWTVTVCVTDAAGETGCDTTTATVDGAHGKLTPEMHPGKGLAKGLATGT